MAVKVDVKYMDNGTCVVKVEGRLDLDTCTYFEDKMKPVLETTTKAVVFDMARLEYVSSVGLSAIFKVRKHIEHNNGVFIMTNLQPQIRKVFDIIKALAGTQVFESMEEVDHYLDVIQKKEINKQKDIW